jgi:hypothetical protein
MKLSEMNNKYVSFAEIALGDGEFVKLREPTVGELDAMNKAKDEDRVAELSRLFPNCLVDHSFSKNDDNAKKASSEEVYQELKKSGSFFMEIITAWMACIPFNKRLKKEQS